MKKRFSQFNEIEKLFRRDSDNMEQSKDQSEIAGSGKLINTIK